MAAPQSSMIIKKLDGFGGSFVDSQYLGNSYESGKPHVFQDTLMKIFSSSNMFFTGKPLLSLTGGTSAGVTEIDTEVYRWYLQGAEYKCARSLEVMHTADSTPGLNNTTFQIKLDLDYFHAPDVLFPEDADYPLEIVGNPYQDGIGYIYTVRIQGDDPTTFLPMTYLQPGKEFSKVWTTTASEYNDEFGTQQYPSSFQLESQVGAFAQKLTVTDKAWRDQGRIDVDFLYTDPRTNKQQKITKFLPMAEAKMNDELYMGMEAQYIWGRRQTKPGPNGYWKKTGPGLRQQLADSWIEYYNGALTVDLIKDYLLNIFFSRIDEQNRKVVAMTGTLGSLLFHDMLAAESASFLTLDTTFIKPYSGGPGSNDLQFGAQYRKYIGPEGIELTLIKNPMYDSLRYEKRRHPQYAEYPINSARMTFLDFGMSNAGKSLSSNIQMLRVKDTFRYGYHAGTHTPMGPVKGAAVSALKAGYDLFTEGTGGIWIKDVTRCGELVFDDQY